MSFVVIEGLCSQETYPWVEFLGQGKQWVWGGHALLKGLLSWSGLYRYSWLRWAVMHEKLFLVCMQVLAYITLHNVDAGGRDERSVRIAVPSSFRQVYSSQLISSGHSIAIR